MIQEADIKAIFFAFFLSNLQASSYDASMADQGERLKRLAVPRFRITLRNLHCEGTFGRVYSALYLHPETSREGQVLVKTVAGKRFPPPLPLPQTLSFPLGPQNTLRSLSLDAIGSWSHRLMKTSNAWNVTHSTLSRTPRSGREWRHQELVKKGCSAAVARFNQVNGISYGGH